jgi:hypothetical protein
VRLTNLDGYLNESATAALLGVSVATLRCWSARRKGPPRTVVGRQPIYREQALREWLLAKERDPEATRQAGRSGRNAVAT